MTTPEQRKNNRRLGLILASTALVFFLGILAKILLIQPT
ncbi:MAG: cytochrome oxidase small assembly protein [Burkholderiaceae bacterium]|nr:cytochrome oxidase small assembly protein [Burkholderiaceae bacterium]